MRTPTPAHVLYDWHRRALEHMQACGNMRTFDDPPTHEPRCGFYERRMVKDGPWVPAAVWMEQRVDEDGELTEPEFLMCEVNGRPADAEEVWTHICGHPITEARYRFLHADTRWVKTNAPDDPRNNPTKPINPATMPLAW